jgi:hypothetical protein
LTKTAQFLYEGRLPNNLSASLFGSWLDAIIIAATVCLPHNGSKGARFTDHPPTIQKHVNELQPQTRENADQL